ncbi:MAG: type IV toxin-antitoxin system AbiEi family antitoxin domain-containing protein [Acidimicrobiales bacterium]
MRYTTIDNKIRALAARQHQLFNRQQASRLGASARFIDRRLAAGDWARPETGVYGIAGHPMTWRRRLKAAELGTPDSAIAGFAAAALHELTDFRPGRPEIVLFPGVICRHPTLTVHRQAGFATTVVDGIRATTIAQTLFDVAPRVDLLRLERALDDALVAGRLTVAQLEERLAFYEGSRRAGVPRLRGLTGERSAEGWVPPASELEAHLYAMLDRLRSRPRYIRQAAWPWRPDADGRVDAFLPDQSLIVEGDGRIWHTRIRDFDRDRWRDNQAAAKGLRVMRFTYVHLTQFPADVDELMEVAIRFADAA